MNILGIDYGTKYIGLAWMQEGLDVVLPYGLLTASNAIAELKALVLEEKIDTIVVGLPLTLDTGNENLNTKRVRAFVEELSQVVDTPIHFIDERLSSQAADDMGGDASRDEKAAMVILQNYKENGPVAT